MTRTVGQAEAVAYEQRQKELSLAWRSGSAGKESDFQTSEGLSQGRGVSVGSAWLHKVKPGQWKWLQGRLGCAAARVEVPSTVGCLQRE